MSNRRFDFDKRIEKDGPRLLYISVSKYGGDWHSTMHTHYFTELFYVTSGRGSFNVSGKAITVKENDLVFINPNVEHTEFPYNGEAFEYIVVGIEGIEFDLGTESGYIITELTDERKEMLFYFHVIIGEVENKSDDYNKICQRLLDIVLIKLMRRIKRPIKVAPVQLVTKECGLVQRYIDANYRENITLDLLAAQTHMSKYYLVHAFTKHTGLSPISYLISRRIEISKHLLATTDYPISQIAGVTGFSSQSYFTQIFKKLTGETPGEYRKRSKPKAQKSV